MEFVKETVDDAVSKFRLVGANGHYPIVYKDAMSILEEGTSTVFEDFLRILKTGTDFK